MTADSRRRWDTDDRLVGVADASAFAQGVEELAELERRPGWVAEEPEVHLVPHLLDANIAGLQLAACQTGQDGVLAVSATYALAQAAMTLGSAPGRCSGRSPSRRRACASTSSARSSFEVVTGIPDGSGPFASHGHSVRLTLTPTAIA
jgi:hypothetical protein